MTYLAHHPIKEKCKTWLILIRLVFVKLKIPEVDSDSYMAALGSYYLKDDQGYVDPNGVLYRVYLSNGKSFYLVAGDMKADRDTDPETHQYTYNLNYNISEQNADVIEFIVDLDVIDDRIRKNNDFKNTPWNGEIIRMEKLPITILTD